jgi:hypothetical protein
MYAKIEWTADMIAMLRERRAAGVGLVEIAADLRISTTAARDACVRYGAVKRAETVVTKAPVSAAVQAANSIATLPAGHPISWRAICVGTCLDGVAFEQRALWF